MTKRWFRALSRLTPQVAICLSGSLCLLAPGAAAAGEWYRGDLHAHTTYSDGDSSVAHVIGQAEAVRLDFIAITDHDTSASGEPRHWFDPGYSSASVVLLHGVEWTTALGHAGVWAPYPFDYQPLWRANLTADVPAAVAAAHEAGAFFSINHPMQPAWVYPDTYGADCLEIWNSSLLVSGNLVTIHRFWDDALSRGERLTGVGGSDTHWHQGPLAAFVGLGSPTTWVYAESRDPEGILAGIQAGRVAVSYDVDGPRLELLADPEQNGAFDTVMGESFPAQGSPVDFEIRVAEEARGPGTRVEIPPAMIERYNNAALTFEDGSWLLEQLQAMRGGGPRFLSVIRDGRLWRAWFVLGDVDELRSSDPSGGQGSRYYRAELLGQPKLSLAKRLISGAQLAVANPIYVRPSP